MTTTACKGTDYTLTPKTFPSAKDVAIGDWLTEAQMKWLDPEELADCAIEPLPIGGGVFEVRPASAG